MSLINEALKKAQRMRAEAPPPTGPAGADGAPAPVVIRRGRPIPAQVVVLSILGGAVLIGITLVVTLVLLRPDEPVAPPAPAVAKSTPAPEPSPLLITLPPVGPSLSTTAPAPAAGPATGPAATPPAATSPKAAPPTATTAVPAAATPAASTSNPPTPAAATPVAPAAAATVEPAASAPAPAPTGPAKPDLRVQEFIDRIRVSGIRASATDPRVSMNDRVFKLNDVVDRNLGLRIVGIESGGLTFVDSAGVVYTKNF